MGSMQEFKMTQEKKQKTDKKRTNFGKPVFLEKKGYTQADMSMRYHPVQRFQGKAEPLGSIYDVIQRKHVRFGQYSEVTKEDINGSPEHGDPIIFYETFGGIDDEDKLLNVYRQTCDYAGNTVCIIGLNIKVNDKSALDSSELPDISSLKRKLEGTLQAFHKAYIMPFVWADTNDQGGYTFPYFEVRSELMGTAEALSAGYEHCLYRWIDRDAENDTTEAIIHGQGEPIDIRVMAEKKNESGEDVPVYITGAYNWETQAVSGSSTAEAFLWRNYSSFRTQLNQAKRALKKKGNLATNSALLNALKELKIIDGDTLPENWGDTQVEEQLNAIDWSENQLRETYKESVMQKLIKELNEKELRLRASFFQLKQRVVYGDHHKPSFYLPESLMLMNPEAHRKMYKRLQIEAQVADAENSGQSRESLAAFDPGDWRNVEFRSDFSVTKPNKIIDGKEYLHKLRELIQPDFTIKLLCTQLVSLRQSAFDNRDWAFVSGQNGTWVINGNYSRAPEEGELTPLQAQNGLNAIRSELATEMYNNVSGDIFKVFRNPDRR